MRFLLNNVVLIKTVSFIWGSNVTYSMIKMITLAIIFLCINSVLTNTAIKNSVISKSVKTNFGYNEHILLFPFILFATMICLQVLRHGAIHNMTSFMDQPLCKSVNGYKWLRSSDKCILSLLRCSIRTNNERKIRTR